MILVIFPIILTILLSLLFDVYNPSDKSATTSKVEYDLFGDDELLGHGVLSYEDIPLNGRPQFFSPDKPLL